MRDLRRRPCRQGGVAGASLLREMPVQKISMYFDTVVRSESLGGFLGADKPGRAHDVLCQVMSEEFTCIVTVCPDEAVET